MTVTDVNVVKSAIFERPDDANKGTLGSLLCVCGSYGMAGAAVMSAKGALRTGIGLAKCALPRSIYPSSTSGVVEFSIKENTIFNVSSHTPSPQPTRVADDLHDSLTKNGTFTFEILPSAFSLRG